MRRRRWIVQAIVLLMLFILPSCWLAANQSTPSAAPPAISSPSPSTASPTPSPLSDPSSLPPAPTVNSDRLLQHLHALNFKRYTQNDRATAREYLAQTLASFGWQPEAQSFKAGVNLVARRMDGVPTKGTILVTAHYDTVNDSPGADDNASAIAAILELARLFRNQDGTARSLQLALFDQEETGLRGSLAFAADPANLTQLEGVINLDMLGYACYTPGCQQYPKGLPVTPPSLQGDFIAIVGDQEHLPLLKAFQDQTRETDLPPVLILPVPLKGLLTPDVLRSDHAPFWAKNIGAVLVSDTANFRNPHYHQPSDTPDTIDPMFLTGVAQRVVNVVHRLLNSQESLATPIDVDHTDQALKSRDAGCDDRTSQNCF